MPIHHESWYHQRRAKLWSFIFWVYSYLCFNGSLYIWKAKKKKKSSKGFQNKGLTKNKTKQNKTKQNKTKVSKNRQRSQKSKGLQKPIKGLINFRKISKTNKGLKTKTKTKVSKEPQSYRKTNKGLKKQTSVSKKKQRSQKNQTKL